MPAGQKFHTGAALHIGRNPKRGSNQDRVGVFEPVAEQLSESLYVVCDGMGGHSHGELASQIAVDEIVGAYRQARGKHPAPEAIRVAFRRAHEVIRRAGKGIGAGRSMGTTAVAAVAQEGRLHIANVGDSRAYLVRSGKLHQITQDHTRSAELRARALSSAVGAARGPARHALTRSLSTLRETVEPDLFEEAFNPGDVLVLCSDGLWGMVAERAITHTVSSMSPQDAADALVNQANRAGGTDNISVIVVGRRSQAASDEEDTGEMLVGAGNT
ncbi:MAG: PP2C family protein-serine/threonine phosphatase [Anaerolineales bacterium]